MVVRKIDPIKYGRLCAQVAPRVIETRGELDRAAAAMEEIDRKDKPSPEEEAMSELLVQLIDDYQRKHVRLPKLAPVDMLNHLMDNRGLRQADLLEIFGSRSIASDVVNGKREISKTHARGLADYFEVPADRFI